MLAGLFLCVDSLSYTVQGTTRIRGWKHHSLTKRCSFWSGGIPIEIADRLLQNNDNIEDKDKKECDRSNPSTVSYQRDFNKISSGFVLLCRQYSRL